MPPTESNARIVENLKAIMTRRHCGYDTLTPTITTSPPPSTPFHLSALSDEIKVMILRHALTVNRIKPMYAYMFGEQSIIRRFSCVSKKIRGIAREIYYGENTVVIERSSLPYQDHKIARAMIQVPSIVASPWIRHLEMRLTVENIQDWENGPMGSLSYAHILQLQSDPLAVQLRRDLGVLIRLNDNISTRTLWQKNLGVLRELKIILRFTDHAVCSLRDILNELPEHWTTDLRLERIEVDIEIDGKFRQITGAQTTYRCTCDIGGTPCSELLANVIKKTVRLRPRLP